MEWLFFLVVCPEASMDFCEPYWNDQRFETKIECEQGLKEEVALYEDSGALIFQAHCRQNKKPKKDGDAEKQGKDAKSP